MPFIPKIYIFSIVDEWYIIMEHWCSDKERGNPKDSKKKKNCCPSGHFVHLKHCMVWPGMKHLPLPKPWHSLCTEYSGWYSSLFYQILQISVSDMGYGSNALHEIDTSSRCRNLATLFL